MVKESHRGDIGDGTHKIAKVSLGNRHFRGTAQLGAPGVVAEDVKDGVSQHPSEDEQTRISGQGFKCVYKGLDSVLQYLPLL